MKLTALTTMSVRRCLRAMVLPIVSLFTRLRKSPYELARLHTL